ncbi:hypothetical protein [Streptomyces sp. MP131-18]|uniref:hypothetical protein n=1 Tax=Streptomyces sp. MP131-18 TaxID=1857892 RepID=UPI00097C788E|nr:hypothetical protein [Streptomyces sp. MP131-18]ONK09462.1 hypothetical protein STBA_01620 [Streptomyces sp. MP131-18]
MSTADVARLAGLMARRLDAVHPVMLPLVVLLLVAVSLVAVPLTATGGVLVLIRRALTAAVNYQPRKRVKS